jgi:hypothetical protein
MLNLRVLLVICASIAFFLLGCGRKTTPTELSGKLEQARVTSPSGQLDAVLIREDAGGATGGWEWNVYIVPRGNPVLASYHQVLYAGTLTDPKLVWSQEHLLQIHYDVADIHEFRNLWALDEVRKVGPAGEGDYLVEIRLSPSSPDFSLLTPMGSFKQRQ